MYKVEVAIELNKLLADIANKIGQMAIEGTANATNPLFNQIMSQHADVLERQFRLLNEELHNRMP